MHSNILFSPLFLCILALVCLIPTESAQSEPNQPPPAQAPVGESPPVKNGTAPGRYYGGGGDYSAEQSGEYEYAYGASARLVDDYICDMDASILVVTNNEKRYSRGSYGKNEEYGSSKGGYAGGRAATAPSAERSKRGAGYGLEEEERGGEYGGGRTYGKGGYGGYAKAPSKSTYSVAKAHRLRCSAIAVNSDEDCRKCCQMAARKERSISKESIVGFIVDYDEVRQPNGNSGYGNGQQYRPKREAAYPPAVQPNTEYTSAKKEEYGKGNGYGSEQKSYGTEAGQQSYGGQSSGYKHTYPQKPNNPRCVCCAPKVSYAQSYDNAQKNYGGRRNEGGYYGQGSYSEEDSDEYGGERYGQGERQQQNYGSNESGGHGRKQQRHGYGRQNQYGGRKAGGYGNE